MAFGLEGQPTGLDPTKNAWDGPGLQVANALFDPLAAIGADGRPRPYLAAAIEPNADYTQWTIKTRPRISFHDGSPATAVEIAEFMETIRKHIGLGPTLSFVQKATAVDAETIKVDMKRPWASYPMMLTGQTGMPASPKQMKDEKGATKPLGTGPFKLRDWELGKEIQLERNDFYWRRDANGARLPYLDSLRFRSDGQNISRIGQLRQGSFDIIHTGTAVNLPELADLADDKSMSVTHDAGPAETIFAMFNTSKAPLNDVRVRRAAALATDRQQLARTHNWPVDRLTRSVFPTTAPWFDRNAQVPDYNLDEARRLVDEYVDQTGTRPTFVIKTGDEAGLSHQLAEMWNRAGMRVRVEEIDSRQRTILALAADYDAIIFQYFAAADPDELWHFWHSSTLPAPGEKLAINFSRFADPRIDRAMDDARASGDPEVRTRNYRVVQQMLAEHVPYIAMVRLGWVIATRSGVHNARNVTLPDGSEAAPYDAGVFRLAETWTSG